MALGSEGNVSKPAGIITPHPLKNSGEHFVNTFACDALSGNGNEEFNDCNKKYKVQTDTDSDGKTEIITDLKCNFEGKAFEMEVKVDPGSETNCIPLSHFRCLFPQLCREDGLSKEKALGATLAQFEAYDGGILQAHRWFMVPTQDITRAKKFHPVRYYMVDREEARILISHATASWLGLVEVKCKNKAPKIIRQVATVTKIQSQSDKSICLSGPEHPPKEKYSLATSPHPPKVKYTTHNNKMVTEGQQEDKSPTSAPHSCGRKSCRGKPSNREEDSAQDLQSTKVQVSQPNNKQDTRVQSGQSISSSEATHPRKVNYFSHYN